MYKVLLLSIVFILVLSGCNAQTQNESSMPNVVIDLPKDNSVNGYRTSSEVPITMPKTIKAEDTVVASDVTDYYTEINKVFTGNANSKVFHLSDCSFAENAKEENKVYFASRDEFIQNGYKPCSRCKP